MDFNNSIPIYLQIAELIKEKILQNFWSEGDKIQSVRELAVEIEVNPNTVMRTYSKLQQEGIIKNKRGKGYFVSVKGSEIIMKTKKNEFETKKCPDFFKSMELLKINFEELQKLYENYKENKGVK
jgi:DNA-binding transcriptional regulator YhcF (GntR family)